VPFAFKAEQVRVLLFRECESRRRKILFDSCSVQKIALEPQNKSARKFPSLLRGETKKTDPVFAEVTNGYGYKVGIIFLFNLCNFC
jgi:hypothetical protein